MYAAIRRGKGKPGSVAEVASKVQQGLVSIMSSVPGFVAYYVVQTGEDELVTVTVFESQAGAEESNKVAANWVRDNLGPLMAGPLELSAGEVVVHKGK